MNYKSIPVQFRDEKYEVKMTTGNVRVSITKSPLLITFSDAAGMVYLADQPDLPLALNGKRIHIWKKMPPEENYLCRCDKARPINRHNPTLPHLKTALFGFTELSDPTFPHIP